MPSHGISVQGPGGTAARAITQIGSNITFPAGGPWEIYGIWAQVVKASTVPVEGTGGELILNAVSGDLTPDPAPGKYPLIGACASESANSAIAAVPLNLWPVKLQAAGKAVISLSYRNQLGMSTASEVAAGIIFGESVPEIRPIVFCDSVQASFASATEQSIGTITLSQKATKITGILCDLNKGDTPTAGEEILATVRLASDDVKMPPMQFPCNRAFNASDGTAVGQSATPMSQFIPLDIPIPEGARIEVLATTSISVTGNADIAVYIAYE